MNTNRKLATLLTAFLLLAATAASAEHSSAPKRILEVPNTPIDVEVDIWTDRGDSSRYCAGEPIEIYFRTNVDAWVAIYDIDTRGRVSKLFPSRHASNNFVRGGTINRVPSRYGYHFEVEGPSGWETLRAVASTDRWTLRNTGRNDDRWKRNRRRGEDREWGHEDRGPGRYRPTALPVSSKATPVPNKIREEPDGPRYDPEVAVAETRLYVRDGYRCHAPRPRPTRPWWHR